MYTVWKTVEHSLLNGISSSHSSLKAHGFMEKRRLKGVRDRSDG